MDATMLCGKFSLDVIHFRMLIVEFSARKFTTAYAKVV